MFYFTTGKYLESLDKYQSRFMLQALRYRVIDDNLYKKKKLMERF